MQKRLDEVDVEKAVEFVMQCMNFDGGFGRVPGSESHAGQVRFPYWSGQSFILDRLDVCNTKFDICIHNYTCTYMYIVYAYMYMCVHVCVLSIATPPLPASGSNSVFQTFILVRVFQIRFLSSHFLLSNPVLSCGYSSFPNQFFQYSCHFVPD